MPVWIGTSGWQYRDWRGRFYPEGLAQGRWLEHYAARFDTVEVNNTFYRLPAPATFASWRERLPQGFVMTVKVNRFLTHLKQLKEPEAAVDRFVEASAPLGARTGPMLIQLPPKLVAHPDRLRATLDRFPTTQRLAVEFRHQSWFDDRVRAILTERNAALVLTDRHGRLLEPEWVTADWGYVRLHEGDGPPWPHYPQAALQAWADRLARLWPAEADVYVYFNNDPGCWAVADAIEFARCVARTGRAHTSVPASQEVAPRAAA